MYVYKTKIELKIDKFYHPVACPAGKYKDDTMNVCTDCTVNSVSRNEGASQCEPCPSGTVSNSDKTDCGEFFKLVLISVCVHCSFSA